MQPDERTREESGTRSKYAVLPEPVRREDLVTTHDVRPQPAEKGEHDRETEWMLRTTGLFL